MVFLLETLYRLYIPGICTWWPLNLVYLPRILLARYSWLLLTSRYGIRLLSVGTIGPLVRARDFNVEMLTSAKSMEYDVHHEKTDLKVFVVFIPKEGWACMDGLFRIWLRWHHRSYSRKFGVMPKEGWAQPCAPILLVFQVTKLENHLVKRFTNAYVSDNVRLYKRNMLTLDKIVAQTVLVWQQQRP